MASVFIFYTIVFLVLLVLPAGLILTTLFFLEHERALWKRVGPFINPVRQKFGQSQLAVGIETRFPRTMGFVVHRLDARDPWGLPATLAGMVMLVGLWFFLGVLQDIMARDPLVVLDLRLHNTVPIFRSAGMTRLTLVVTELGGPAVLLLLCLGAALLALANSRRRLAITFTLALAGTALLSVGFKMLIGHARPVDALLSMRDASFPSGHMLSGTVVYGLLAALLMGSSARRGVRALGVSLLLIVIVGIGLSRLYLGVHWPSDLLGSLGLALMMLSALLFFLHFEQPLGWIDTFRLPASSAVLRVAGVGTLVAALAAVTLLSNPSKIITVAADTARKSIDMAQLRSELPPDLARWSEDLLGGRMEPISLVLVGSQGDILNTFRQAGWVLADPPTPIRVLTEGLAALRNLPDPAGPATPSYFMDQPQTLTFEKPDSDSPGIRRRHHTRLWKTPYCLAPTCRQLWVGTASFDVGMAFSQRLHLPTHRIDSALDLERALIADELVLAGAKGEGYVTVSPPSRGNNAAGDPFWTDGHAVILVMP